MCLDPEKNPTQTVLLSLQDAERLSRHRNRMSCYLTMICRHWNTYFEDEVASEVLVDLFRLLRDEIGLIDSEGGAANDIVCSHLCWIWRNTLMVVQGNLSRLVKSTNGVLMVCAVLDILENAQELQYLTSVSQEERAFEVRTRQVVEENLVELSKDGCAHLLLWKMMDSSHESSTLTPLHKAVSNLETDQFVSLCMDRHGSCVVQKCLQQCQKCDDVETFDKMARTLVTHWDVVSKETCGMFVLEAFLKSSRRASLYLEHALVQHWFSSEAAVDGPLFQKKSGVSFVVTLLRTIVGQHDIAQGSAMHKIGTDVIDVVANNSKWMSSHKNAHVIVMYIVEHWGALQTRLHLHDCHYNQLIFNALENSDLRPQHDLEPNGAADVVDMCTNPYFPRVLLTLVHTHLQHSKDPEMLPPPPSSAQKSVMTFLSCMLDAAYFSSIAKHPHGVSTVMSIYPVLGDEYQTQMLKTMQQDFSGLCIHLNACVILRAFVVQYPHEFKNLVLSELDSLATSMAGLTVLSAFIEHAPCDVYQAFLRAVLTQTHANIRRKEYVPMYIDLVDREARFALEPDVQVDILANGKKWQTRLLDQITMGSPKMAYCSMRSTLLCKLLDAVGTDKHASTLFQELDRKELGTREFGCDVMLKMIEIASFPTLYYTLVADFKTVLPVHWFARKEPSYRICVKLLEMLQAFEEKEGLLGNPEQGISARKVKHEFLASVVHARQKIASSSHGRHFLRVAMVQCEDLDSKALISRELTLPLYQT